MTNIIEQTLKLAMKSREGQFRKDKVTPYIVHPIQVMLRLKKWGISNEIIWQAALLHDAVEDGGITLEALRVEVGDKVANIVHELTLYKGQDKQAYLDDFGNKSCEAIIVKIADRFCNSEDFDDAGDWQYARKYFSKAEKVYRAFQETKNDITAIIGEDSYDFIDCDLNSTQYWNY